MRAPPVDMLALPERYLAKLMPLPWCGCWVYDGLDPSRNGYGRVWRDGEREQLHIVVWELLVGPVPPGLVLDHLCRVRACAYPGHLEPVTHGENIARGDAVLYKPGWRAVA